MPIEAYILIASGILAGLSVGFMPSIGQTLVFVMLWPILTVQPFDAVIAFMMVVYTSVFFSSSVTALWLGVAGDPTSFPILQERNKIPKEDYGIALKRTALASSVTAIVGIVLTILLINIASNYLSFFIKTSTNALLIIAMVLVSIFWAKNKIYQNIILITVGIIVGITGWHAYLNAGFFIFNNPYLYNGIPALPVILGVYAIPIMWESAKEGWTAKKTKLSLDSNVFKIPNTFKIPFGPILRGGIIGYITGIMPMIGTSIASNVSWAAENRYQKNKPTLENPALNRITASESANNAAAAGVVAPLLVLGVAIIPSEMMILTIMQENGWSTAFVTKQTLLTVVISVALSCFVLYKMCVTYAGFVIHYFFKYQFYVLLIFLGILIYGIYHTGNNTLQAEFYLTVLFIASLVGFVLKKMNWNPIPMIITLLISDVSIPVLMRSLALINSYF